MLTLQVTALSPDLLTDFTLETCQCVHVEINTSLFKQVNQRALITLIKHHVLLSLLTQSHSRLLPPSCSLLLRLSCSWTSGLFSDLRQPLIHSPRQGPLLPNNSTSTCRLNNNNNFSSIFNRFLNGLVCYGQDVVMTLHTYNNE